MADWYPLRNGDFDEAEVWSFSNQTEASSASSTTINRKPSSLSSSFAIVSEGKASAAVMVHRSSAPMNIPDWAKIYGANNGGHYVDYYQNNDDGGDDSDDEEEDVVAPHEWLAKKLARSRVSSFSVCEGMGRTLKGRDLSKVRNAILTKTGFLE